MSGRGKGGKGLGKGGAKRRLKVLRDNMQGITKPAIRRLARRSGEETRSVLKVRRNPGAGGDLPDVRSGSENSWRLFTGQGNTCNSH